MWSRTKLTSMAPGDFVHFKAHVPLQHISIGSTEWKYYDYGPKVVPPLVCLSGTAGTAEVFYKIILSLSLKGYRVIAADAPPLWSHQEWISSFEKFLDTLGVHHVHLYGTSLGGFLGQLFAQFRPRRVKSLMLSNTFLDTRCFAAAMSWSSLINWTPEFMLKRYILSGIRDVPQEPLIADSIDFVVSQLETLSREELASRLTLNTSAAQVGQISLPDSVITIMDTNDYCAIPQALKDQVAMRYPGARHAFLKAGGDFPFLSRADEVVLHAQLHLRRAGVEALSDEKYKALDGNGDASGSEDQQKDDTSSRNQQQQQQRRINNDVSASGSRKPMYRSASQLKSLGNCTQWKCDHTTDFGEFVEEYVRFLLVLKEICHLPFFCYLVYVKAKPNYLSNFLCTYLHLCARQRPILGHHFSSNVPEV